MGESNSSVTRVWPIFDHLFHGDPSGITWLPQLLQLGSQSACAGRLIDDLGPLMPHWSQFDRDLPGLLQKVLGPSRTARIGRIRNAFESDIPPSEDFLRWLLEHPQKMKWPLTDRSKKIKRRYADYTQHKREQLLAGDPSCRDEALHELSVCGVDGSRRRWWAFEGFTSVDCRLETDNLLVLVEGKRTEQVSSSTDWFPLRNQVIRNTEVARALARGRKNYAVLVCAEEEVKIPPESWEQSLPHMTESEVADLQAHFLGCVTWRTIAAKLCGNMILPNTLDEAVSLCMRYR